MKCKSGFSLAMASLPFRKSQLAKLAIIVPTRRKGVGVFGCGGGGGLS